MDVKEDYVCLLVEKGVFFKMCIVLPEVINFIVIKKANAQILRDIAIYE